MSSNSREYNRLAKQRQRKGMKVPSKYELYAQNDALIKENAELQDKLKARIQREWELKRDKAFEVFYEVMRPRFGGLLTGVKLEHVDESGYWFSFELTNNDRRQTYAVRHSEVV